MKRTILTALALLTTATFAPLASADVWTNASGSICKAYNAADISQILPMPSGTSTLKSTPTTVICPLTRSTVNSNGAYVYADVYHGGYQTTTCTAYSFAPGGRVLALASGSWSGAATGSVFINLAGFGKSGFSSDYTVLCTIPGFLGTLTSIHIDEL